MNIGVFYQSTQLAVVLIRADGLVWDWAQNTFAALPTSGVPAMNQFKLMTKPIATGPLSQNFFLSGPPAIDPAGVWAAFLAVDGKGNLGSQLDLWPAQQLFQMMGLFGGVT